MNMKTVTPPVRIFPNDHEDLEPRARAVAEAEAEAFIAKDRKTVETALEEALADIKRGRLHIYDSLDKLYSDIVTEAQRRRSSTK
jgi:hypothetical protein